MKEKKLELDINGKPYSVTIHDFSAYEASVTVNGKTYTVGLKDLGIEQVSDLQPAPLPQRDLEASNRIGPMPAPEKLHKPKVILEASSILAPLPGMIQKILVRAGDQIKAGQHVIIMEAMKMENEIQAATDGTVKEIKVKEGDSVNEGDVLILME